MCQPSDDESEIPLWVRTALARVWANRKALALPAGCVLALAALGLTAYLALAPSDVSRAEADLKAGWAIVKRLDEEAVSLLDEVEIHHSRCAENRDLLQKHKDREDPAWVEWTESKLEGHRERWRIKIERRNQLIRRTAEFRPLLIAAEREIAHTKNARLRGQRVPVAARVRAILAPLFDTQ